MARSLPYFTFILYLFICKLDFGQCVEVILGDPFTFPEIGNCTGEVTLIHQIGPHSSLQVAGRMQGVWKPRDGYKDRINETPFIHFIRTVYNDAGVYEFICANSNKQSPQIIQLDIVRAEKPSVKEGDAVKLECYYHTVVKRVESVWWTKHGEFVFERHFSSGGDKYGPGHERKVSMSPEGYEEGDLSLLLQRAQMEDEGVYRCYVHTADEGGRRNEASVAAVRLTVNKGASDQTNATTQPVSFSTENTQLHYATFAAPRSLNLTKRLFFLFVFSPL